MTRRRSLGKDGNDWKQLRFGRDRHLGFSVSTEYYQPVPFFYTREGANLNLVGHYRGSSIFIICNGPSVADGTYDLKKLKKPGVMTYGMNNGPRTVRPNFWTCVDDPRRFMKSIWLDPCITKFVPHAHAEKKIFDNEKWEETNTYVGQCPNVLYYHRNEKFMANRFLFEDTINWGNSGKEGGGRSVMLPVMRICFLLGFRTIYLLGADFKMSQNYTYHFDEQRAKGAVKGNNNTYDKLKDKFFPEMKPYLDAEGVQVYNCNPDSALECFEYMPFDQAIHNATAHLGDIANERTWGLYSKPDERQKWKQEPDEYQKGHLAYLKNAPASPITGAHAINVPATAQEPQLPQAAPQIPSSHPIPPPPPLMDQNMIGRTETYHPMPEPQVPMERLGRPSIPLTPQTNGRIIKALPCGLCEGSSGNASNNVTIPDDGN